MNRENEIRLERLRRRLKQALPGAAAHQMMAPPNRMEQLKSSTQKRLAKQSSILIALYPVNEQLHTVFIQRNIYNGHHSGQISFPGGQYEKSDASLTDTALREAREEVGIRPENVQILGKLSQLYIPPSNFMVLPVVGYLPEAPHFIPDPTEVADIIEIPLHQLMDQKNIHSGQFTMPDNQQITAPCFKVNGHIIWGATAMIIGELITLLEPEIPRLHPA